jgi:signal transduction histidine kinase
VLVLLALTLLSAWLLARAVADDARGVTRRIERVARGEEVGPPGAIQTLDVRNVALAVNRLLERVPRLTVETYLAIERASEASRLKSQFLANMSHDLRSPLNSILGFSELLLRGLEGEIQAGQRVTLADMHATGLRLLRLLNEILDTAKAESGKMEMHRQSSSPAELIRQAVAESRRGRSAATDRLSVELQAGLPPISVDPLRLQQVVTHLLDHAFDAAPTGRVTLRAILDANRFVLEVSYAGELAPEDDLGVFDGFRPLHGKPGLNLAVPLARRLVELHGGTLELLAPRDDPTPTTLRLGSDSSDGRIRLRASIPVRR